MCCVRSKGGRKHSSSEERIRRCEKDPSGTSRDEKYKSQREEYPG